MEAVAPVQLQYRISLTLIVILFSGITVQVSSPGAPGHAACESALASVRWRRGGGGGLAGVIAGW